MKIIKSLLTLGLILFITEIFGQELPATYQPMLNEIVTNFKTIRTGNTIKEGKSTLSVINENKIALRIDHQKRVKNLTFITKLDAENKLYWIPANQLTIDMVNKYEEDLTEIFESMLELSEKKSKE
ncbi:MAG: hypothetical protein A2X13_14235 [Bacteroidetes bacterium GWC2_33_15]|nr:MAG: hypothetical protein A2X10_12280 [Bacteroidetes bacterium GWA2_33_15]OFX50034.1 MAG: hypothetical protein A2X13_14235 [Bacteroidetes bacterium GWC2_33_15]OFX65188.1 MAG: hypothetical protein A2X15_03810 [Bacteroidetes bacterium GWB2_32_14]OFX70413.1 MAG: hypothetical protein A2X14_03865 [Bacteroidetes bacterium GWD2_33_33]HAN19719.1 hypothetical protein [Bacteroidales bacterium]